MANDEEQVDEGPEGLLESSSEKMHPNRQEDEQDMEMEPVVFAPPSYGSPDPATGAAQLTSVEETTLELGEDYAKAELEVSSESPAEENGEEEEDAMPAPSATRAEWDEYARSQGVDPDAYSSKDDLIAALS